MRGEDSQQDAMFSYLSPEQRVPQDHPLRTLRQMVDRCSEALARALRGCTHGSAGRRFRPRSCCAPCCCRCLYTVRSERLLMEQLDYNLLFRWFVGLNMDDAVWDATVFSKNRERLLEGEVAEAFFEEVVEMAREHGLLSDEHFTVDGTLIEAWAGQKSFKKKGGRRVRAAGRSRQPHGEFPWGKVRHRCRKRVAWMFTWAAAAYNLVRIRNLIGATA